MASEIPPLRIRRSQKSWSHYAQYLGSEDPKLKETQTALRGRNYQVGQATDVSYRLINHWDQMGLLPMGVEREGAGWRKFSAIEVVWIRMVHRLRAFGLSLEGIAKIKSMVMDQDWELELDTYAMLEYFFMRAIATTEDPYLVVWPDGMAELATTQEIELSKIGNESTDMLLISIKSIAKEMGLHPVKPDTMFSLNKSELSLLDKIRSEDNKTVKARMKDRVIKEIETEKIYLEGTPLQEILESVKKEGGFAEILSRHTDGKRRSVEVKKHYRMKE